MRDTYTTPRCASRSCGRPLRQRPGGTWERRSGGLCCACWFRWARAGRPAAVPPPHAPLQKGSPAALAAAVAARAAARRGRVRKAATLTSMGFPAAEVARRLGVKVATVKEYLREARWEPPAGQAPAPDVREVNGRAVTAHERRVLSGVVAAERAQAAGVLAGLTRAS